MNPSDLVLYYAQLLIMEYFGLPKASGMISAFVTQAVADLIVMQVRAGFALATATGRQLDALGEVVGLQRQVPGYVPGTPEFSMPPYSDVDAGTYVGFARYDDNPVPNGHWKRYTDSDTAFVMTDGQFAQFILFMVAVRASDYSLEALDDIFFQFFGDFVEITDNLNMSMTYTHDSADPGFLFGVLDFLNLLPHPAGVSYSVVTV